MIHEISPHRFSNQYISQPQTGSEDYILHYKDNSILLMGNGDEPEIPRRKDFTGIAGEENSIFLFTLDDIPCFLAIDGPEAAGDCLVYRDISFFRTAGRQEIAWISLAGFHLAKWYSRNRYCGKCGSGTIHKPGERALICTVCSFTVFPQISPAVIVAVTCKDKILLARGSNFTGTRYSLIAGYVDIGETLEEALAREVKEEVGLDVKNIRYYKSQPWPLTGSIMIGFTAEGDDLQPLDIDTAEILTAGWFTRGNLPDHSLNLSIAGEMIERFDKGQL